MPIGLVSDDLFKEELARLNRRNEPVKKQEEARKQYFKDIKGVVSELGFDEEKEEDK